MGRKKGLPSYPGSKLTYFLLGLFSLFEAISITAQAIFLAKAVTDLFHGAAFSSLTKEIIFFLLAFVSRHIFAHIQRALAERFSENMGRSLRKNLINAYFDHGQQFVNIYGTGRIVTLAMEGIDNVKQYVQIAVPKMIRSVILPAIIVIYVFTLDVPSSVILVVTVPVVIIFMILLGIAAEKMADRQYETYRVLSNHFIDSLKGIETLKYLGQSVKHASKIKRVSKEYRKATIRTLRVAFLSSFALDFFTSLSIAFVAVGLGIRLIDGGIVLLPALTILILAPEYFLPIREVGKDYHATLDGQVALEEIENIIQSKPPVHNREKDARLNWSSTSKIQFNNVHVDHEEQRILNNISFTSAHQGMIGIIGPSGAGKSTLINALAGFLHHDEGSILINGIEVKTLKRRDWMEQIAYIPQHPYIFPTSIANNIRFYKPDATDEEVMKIVKQIQMESFIDKLPNGIHETIGEGGRMLSGGQEQRIALARALISERPIILLDEPTAHLDIETEYEIKQVMLHVFKGKLVFFATHRMHWMKQMDYLLVLENGHLKDQGTIEQLKNNKGTSDNLLYKGNI